MAVVQISRIQVRRGQKNQGSGVPQLSGGEFGWALDSRELYIGNGSVAEGAPAVGNTKIVTEHDNLFELADTYTYKAGSTLQTGSNLNSPVKRTLQARLDDIVSIRSFGAPGDGSDQTQAIQRAVDQLYLNSSVKGDEQSRVKLILEPGIYRISNSIKLPPYASLIGAGAEKTVIQQTANFPAFTTVNSDSNPDDYADDSSSTTLTQAQRITIKDLSIDMELMSNAGIELQSCKESLIQNVSINGPWLTGDPIVEENIGIKLNSLSTVVGSHKNVINNVTFKGIAIGIGSDFDVYDNKITDCVFANVATGIRFGINTNQGSQGQSTGPARNTIQNSTFENIDQEAIYVSIGVDNLSSNNIFTSVGNVGGTEGNATYSVIRFDTAGNRTDGDYFSRSKSLGYDQSFLLANPYVSEIRGEVNTSLPPNNIAVGTRNALATLFRLPGDWSRNYRISYNYRSGNVNATRLGVLNLVVDRINNQTFLTDEYDYIGDTNFQENIDFSAELTDTNSDSIVDTVLIKMLNSTQGDDATFTYRVDVQN